MAFLFPLFLFSLLCVGIPILIHLFNFRRYKKIYFTNVKYLLDVEKEAKSRNRLKNIILLTLRMLAIICLVFAFTQPFFPKKNSTVSPGRKYVAIYLDNSFSMNNETKEGQLLEVAKKKVEEVVKYYKNEDKFQLLCNQPELKLRHWMSKEEVLRVIPEIEKDAASKDLSEVLDRMKTAFQKAETSNKIAYLVSDFQKSFVGNKKADLDSSIRLNLINFNNIPQNNMFIDSAWFESPIFLTGKANNLLVRIVNTGSEDIEGGVLNIDLNGHKRPPVTYNIMANGTSTIKVNLNVAEEGVTKIKLNILDYPVTFDDQYYISYTTKSTQKVLILNNGKENKYLRGAISVEPSLSLEHVDYKNADYSAFDNFDVIILNGLSETSTGMESSLLSFLNNGGKVFFIPNEIESGSSSFLSKLNLRIESTVSLNSSFETVDIKNPFYSGLFQDNNKNVKLPTVTKYFRVTSLTYNEKNVKETEILLKYKNGDHALIKQNYGKGLFYLLSVPLDETWTSLMNNSLFYLITSKICFYESNADKLCYTIGKDNFISVDGVSSGDERNSPTIRGIKTEFRPHVKDENGKLNIYLENFIKADGFYSVDGFSDSLQKTKVFSMNYDRKESNMSFATPVEIKNTTGLSNSTFLEADKASLWPSITGSETGEHLWKWFILLTLLTLLTETIVIRLWK